MFHLAMDLAKPGGINTPIVCGGRTVCPRDIVFGDEDGNTGCGVYRLY